MSAPVDVKAVLDKEVGRLTREYERSNGFSGGLVQRALRTVERARDAYAELLASDIEYDAALKQRNNPPNKRERTLLEIEVRWARAICRRAAALRAVGGA